MASAPAQFFPFSGSLLLLWPKSPSPVSAQPGVLGSYAKLVKAAVAYWHVVLGERAVFDSHRAPRMGVFWAGFKRDRIHVSLEKSPFLLGGAHALWLRADTSNVRLRQAVGNSELPPSGSGIGALVDDAYRPVVLGPLAFFGLRLASEIAALRSSDVVGNDSAGVIELKIGRQKNDQSGVGHMALVFALAARRGACPVCLMSEWLLFRARVPHHRGRESRVSAPAECAPLCVWYNNIMVIKPLLQCLGCL